MTDHDPDLAAQFEAMNAIEPPNVWNRVMTGGTSESAERAPASGPARIWFGAAAAAVIVGLIAGGLAWFGPDSRDQAVVAGDAGCNTGRIAETLSQDGPAYDFDPSGSPEALAASVNEVVWGRITAARRVDGRILITAIARISTFSIPSTGDDGTLDIAGSPVNFVAFLQVGDQGLLEPAPEGLWIACAAEDPALSVLVTPDAAGWPNAPRLADLLGAAPAATISGDDEDQTSTVTPAPGPTTRASTSALESTDEIDARAELPAGGPVPPGAPEEVANRDPVPYCGAIRPSPNLGVNPYRDIELTDDAASCYQRRAEQAQPAEMIEILSTPEGGALLVIRRVLPDGGEEWYSDTTRDPLGPLAWFRDSCPRYEPPGSQRQGCDRARRLVSPDPASADSTLFEVTSEETESGPPFYVMADRVAAGDNTVWATQQFTIRSEWQTAIAVSVPNTSFTLNDHQFQLSPIGESAISGPTTIQPGASLPFDITLGSWAGDEPPPGVYKIELDIEYWRGFGLARGPTGRPDGTLKLLVSYEVLDARTAAAISPFCESALGVAPLLSEIDEAQLRSGLDSLESAAASLPEGRRRQLTEAISELRGELDEFFGPEPTLGGLSTDGVIQLINGLCSTTLPSAAVIF